MLDRLSRGVVVDGHDPVGMIGLHAKPPSRQLEVCSTDLLEASRPTERSLQGDEHPPVDPILESDVIRMVMQVRSQRPNAASHGKDDLRAHHGSARGEVEETGSERVGIGVQDEGEDFGGGSGRDWGPGQGDPEGGVVDGFIAGVHQREVDHDGVALRHANPHRLRKPSRARSPVWPRRGEGASQRRAAAVPDRPRRRDAGTCAEGGRPRNRGS